MRNIALDRDVDEVLIVEARALDWVERNFALFNPVEHGDARRAMYVIKAAAELSLVCTLGNGDRYRELAQRIFTTVFRNDAVQRYLLDHLGDVPAIGFYASMRQCGFEDESFRARLQLRLDRGHGEATERTPTSELDYVHSLMLAGFESDHSVAAMFRRTLLSRHPPLRPLTNDDVYALTHAMFFATDFGRVDPTFFTRGDRDYIATAFPQLLAYYVWRQNWDLAAELLLSLDYAGTATREVFAEEWRLLIAAQNEDGSYDGPLDDVVSIKPDTPDAEEWVAFRNNYHTTLAVLLAIGGRASRL